MNLLIGADPEVFVRKFGELISGYNLIPGTKEEPYKVDKGAVQVDGMALEFNIDPASSEGGFVENIEVVMEQLRAMVPDCELDVSPTAYFGAEYIATQPEEAVILGCDPDFNAYKGGDENPMPDQEAPFRTGAGHVHLGWSDDTSSDSTHNERCCATAKQLDLYLGLPSLLFDEDTQRRTLYGQAGAYRPKTYGMEYRTLSNKWVSCPELTAWVFRASRKAVLDLENGIFTFAKYGEELATIINSSDVERAREIIEAENLEIPNVLGKKQ